MTSWQSGSIEANGLLLHYTRTGGAKPPLVLAHGFSDDGLCWAPVAEALAPTYDVIMVDSRGHGRSAAPEQGYGPSEQAADLAGVIAGLGLSRPAILGHSMGAATTLVLAGSYPDVPGAILLEDPPPWWVASFEQSRDAEQRQKQMREWLIALKRKTYEELIADQRAQTPGWSEAELEPWANAKLRLSLNVLNRSAPTNVNWSTTMRRITCPALLITADPTRGAIITEANASALQTLISHLRIRYIPEAGHSIRRDQFTRYMDVVRAFLAETSGAD